MKRPAYPRTKPSGVEWLGDVPEHWEVKRGRFAMRVNPPAPRLRALQPADEVSFIPMDAVGIVGGLNLEQTRVLADVSGGYTEFQDGDVVVAKITPCFENGKAALASGLMNGAAYGTTELHVLRAGPTLDCSFLFYVAISDTFQKLGESEMYGAGGQKRVPPEFNKNFRTPLPPSAEQRFIAAFLDRETRRIDRLVNKKRELIQRLKEKRTALISRAVTRGLPPAVARAAGLPTDSTLKPTDLDWLGDIPSQWKLKKLRYLCEITTGDKDTIDALDEGEFPFFVRSQTVERIDSYSFDCEAVLTAGDGVGVGKVFHHHQGKFAAHQRVYVLHNFKEISGRFLFMFMKEFFARLALGGEAKSTVDSLRRPIFTDFVVLLPPPAEQAAITAYLDKEIAKLDALVDKVEEAVERLQEYRTALITAAVTGKVDVQKEMAA